MAAVIALDVDVGDMAIVDVEAEAVVVDILADVVVVENTVDAAVVVVDDNDGSGFGVGMGDDGRIQCCWCSRRTRMVAVAAVSRRR